MICCKAHEEDSKSWCKRYDIVFTDKEGEGYCVFHAPKDKKGISLEEFNNLVFEEIHKAKAVRRECDLTSVIFPGPIDFSKKYHEKNPLPKIGFFNAEFNGEANFMLVEFSDAFFIDVKFDKVIFVNTKFNGDANFNGSEFNGEALFGLAKFNQASFANVTFNDEANFSNSTFTEKADFSKSKFNKDATFDDAIFSDEADFRGSIFRESSKFIGTEFKNEANFSVVQQSKAVFAHAKFNEALYFIDSEISKGSDFSKTTFSKEADFNGTTFEGFANFNLADFKKFTQFSKGKHKSIFGSGALFTDIKIGERLRLENINLNKVYFIGTDIRKIDFINCNWEKKYGRNILYDEIVALNRVKLFYTELLLQKIIERFKRKERTTLLENGYVGSINNIKKVGSLYRLLKQKYKEEHNEPEVSNWHYGEKEMFRKEIPFRRYFPFSISNLYWLSSGYGERPVRAGLSLMFLLLGISILLTLSGLDSLDNTAYGIVCIKGVDDITDLYKFKIAILNTLQYATFQRESLLKPSTVLGAYLKLMAQILIPIQAAFFAFALRNRFRR